MGDVDGGAAVESMEGVSGEAEGGEWNEETVQHMRIVRLIFVHESPDRTPRACEAEKVTVTTSPPRDEHDVSRLPLSMERTITDTASIQCSVFCDSALLATAIGRIIC